VSAVIGGVTQSQIIGGANLSAALGGLDILVNNAGRQQSRESILGV
jgi:NAD(P)-dependent dehydrogenase (short-subunit alcohol dehydrogenase family)